MTAQPLRISRLTAIDAFHQGIDSADADDPVTACPYRSSGTYPEQFAAQWWVKGWRRRAEARRHTDRA